jgi:hypothetical protein
MTGVEELEHYGNEFCKEDLGFDVGSFGGQTTVRGGGHLATETEAGTEQGAQAADSGRIMDQMSKVRVDDI